MTSQNVVKFEVSLEIDLNLKKGDLKIAGVSVSIARQA